MSLREGKNKTSIKLSYNYGFGGENTVAKFSFLFNDNNFNNLFLIG